MPDAEGKFKGVAVPADAWERIFGGPKHLTCPDGHNTELAFESHSMIPYCRRCGHDVETT